jgi:amidase/6-aminohexanoate-cyclic-dimer hydrolase
MLSFQDYRAHDAIGLATLIRTRQVSASEVLETAIARLEAVNGEINAVVLKHYDLARAALKAGLPQGPLHGVPYLLKDIGIAMKGTPTTASVAALKDLVAPADSTLMERTRAAGVSIFGKTHTPEMGLSSSSESRLFGATRNPWNRDVIAGGSSGGAAAAVAAGVLPLAHATDGGGSIRIPAACCGLFGLKPSRGRTPAGPARGEGWGGMSAAHAVSRSVRDNALWLDLTHGPAPGDPYAAPAPRRPYLTEAMTEPAPLRIGLPKAPPLPFPVHADCEEAVASAAKLLASLGHYVEHIDLPAIDPMRLLNAQGVVLNANIAATLEEIGTNRGRKLEPHEVERATWVRATRAAKATSTDYAAAMTLLHQTGRAMGQVTETVDVILQPTLAKPPLPLGVLDMDREDLDALFRDLLSFIPFTGLYNISGQPSMSVPLHWNREGLPIGVMVSAAYGREDILFQLAGQLERAQPWFGKVPD